MSGFAVIYDRSNTPVDPGVLDRMLKRLDHRGPDGQDNWLSGSVAMGHLHFWTTPEELGERQPLRLMDSPYTIVMDGRLDNRSDIINRLNINHAEGSHLSDVNVVLQAYARWGTGCFKDLIGEYVIVIWDAISRELVCVRDAVGDRTLFYAFQGTQILIASEAWALAAGLERQVQLDERAIVYNFALKFPEDGQSFFKGILELLPAHWMKITVSSDILHRYWEPQTEKRNPRRSVADYAEEFREVLEMIVGCRLRSITPPGIMMSGGLDSTSVACLAAKMLAPTSLTTISYVFDKFPDCDERQYIDAVKDQYGMRSIRIPCDDLWPFASWPEWPIDLNGPSSNPYRLILERTYSRAMDEGIRVLLTGMFGDNLYGNSLNWLADLVLDGRFSQFRQEITYLKKRYGLTKVLNFKLISRIVKQVLLTIPGMNSLRRRTTPAKWLTPYSASLLDQKSFGREDKKKVGLLNLRDASGNSREIYNSNRYTIELRTPFHDRRLIEFFLGLPAYLLYSKGVTRRILRTAMTGILPEIVRLRPFKTNLLSLYNYGVQQKSIEVGSSIFTESAIWQKYVNPDVVLKEWENAVTPKTDGVNSVLPALCIFYEIWYNSILNDENYGGING